MDKPLKKIYIGGSLTQNSEEGKRIYEKLGEELQKFAENVYVPHLQGTDPVQHPDVTPKQVWEKDYQEITTSDLLIGYVGKPSLGLGGELEISRIEQVDTIIWWYQGDKVSRLPRGNPGINKQIEAENNEDAAEQIINYIKEKYAK